MHLPAGKVMPASGGMYSPPFKKAAGGLHHISGVSILQESYRKWKNTLIKNAAGAASHFHDREQQLKGLHV